MGRIDVIISDEMEKKLRQRALDKHAGKKGSLKLIIEEALEKYLKEK